MVKQYYFLLIIMLLGNFSGHAQHPNLYFDFTGGGGRLIPHYPSMNNFAGSVAFFNARVGLKTAGQKEWQRVYNYPEIGLGLSHNRQTKSFLGNPTAAYTFMNMPMFSLAKLKLNLGMHLGLAWGFNPFSEQNPENIAIGSKCTTYASLNLNTSFRIGHNADLLLSAGGYHYSNGNTNKPNKGINMLGAETGLRYTFSGSVTAQNTEAVSPIKRYSSIMAFGAWGWKKEGTYGSIYPVGSFSIGYYRTINHKSRLSAGIDLFYDEGALFFTQRENQLINVLAAGLFGGHELTFNRLSIVTQLGIYLRNPHPFDPFHYERVGIRYIIAKRIIPSLSLKAHALKVDFVEWGLGFVLWKS